MGPAAVPQAPHGLDPGPVRAGDGCPRLTVTAATPTDIEDVLGVDCAAFDSEPVIERQWLEPHLVAERVTVALARLDGEPVGTAYALRSDGLAGPAAYVAGVAVIAHARRRGVAGALSSWLLERAFAAGADLAHLHPDDDDAARVYARLGFREVAGFDVYVDLDAPHRGDASHRTVTKSALSRGGRSSGAAAG